jgi:hypothetical protein
LPASDLLEWLERRSRSGELMLSRGSVAKTFRIETGRITSASSNDPREYLGQYLVDLGYMTAEDFSRVSLVKLESSALLGQIITAVGLVGDAEVRECLGRKIRDGICDVVAWADGNFRFEENVLAGVGADITLALPLGDVLRESVERARAWTLIRQTIPDRSARLSRSVAATHAQSELLAELAGLATPPGERQHEHEERIEQLVDQELLRSAEAGLSVERALAVRRSLEYTVLFRLLTLIAQGELFVEPTRQVRRRA